MSGTGIKYLFFSLRPQQWVKNLFIFLPLVFGKQLLVPALAWKSALAFCFFSLMGSAVYQINDILDLEKDKLHPSKRLRPIASGKISIRQAAVTAVFLGGVSAVLSFALKRELGYITAGYFVLNLLYSKILKDTVILDVFCIGGFFFMRILAGSVVTGIELSHWIIIMSVLLALFLGFAKRRQELKLLRGEAASHRLVFAKYSLHFIDQILSVVTSSIVIAYMLYCVDARTIHEFGTRDLLWSAPFVYYGIFRYLYLMHNIYRDGDPTRVLLSDRMMQLNLVLWLAACITVIY